MKPHRPNNWTIISHNVQVPGADLFGAFGSLGAGHATSGTAIAAKLEQELATLDFGSSDGFSRAPREICSLLLIHAYDSSVGKSLLANLQTMPLLALLNEGEFPRV